MKNRRRQLEKQKTGKVPARASLNRIIPPLTQPGLDSASMQQFQTWEGYSPIQPCPDVNVGAILTKPAKADSRPNTVKQSVLFGFECAGFVGFIHADNALFSPFSRLMAILHPFDFVQGKPSSLIQSPS